MLIERLGFIAIAILGDILVWKLSSIPDKFGNMHYESFIGLIILELVYIFFMIEC